MKFNLKLFTTIVITYRVFFFLNETTSDVNNCKNVYTQLGFNTKQYYKLRFFYYDLGK